MGKNKMKKGAVLAVVVFALTFIMILTTFILQLVAMGAKRAVKTITTVNNNILCEYIGTQFKTDSVNYHDLTSYTHYFNSEYQIVDGTDKEDNTLDNTDTIMLVKKSDGSNGFVYKIVIDGDFLTVEYETNGNVILYVNRLPEDDNN